MEMVESSRREPRLTLTCNGRGHAANAMVTTSAYVPDPDTIAKSSHLGCKGLVPIYRQTTETHHETNP
jgi:hypothetical protein